MTYYPPPVAPNAPRPPKKRRRRPWGLLLAVLVVLAALLVVGDRAAAQFAGDELRSRVVAELAARDLRYDSIEVEVAGTPFLTQAASGNFDEITIDLTNVTLPPDATGAGAAVDIRSLRMIGRGVQVNASDLIRGEARATAQEVAATIVLDYSTLDLLVDFSRFHLTDVRFSESGGGLKFAANASALGVSAPVEALADIAVVGGRLEVTLREASFVSVGVPDWGRGLLDDLVTSTIEAKLPQLPYGLALTAVRPQPQGLSITATGTDVPLAG